MNSIGRKLVHTSGLRGGGAPTRNRWLNDIGQCRIGFIGCRFGCCICCCIGCCIGWIDCIALLVWVVASLALIVILVVLVVVLVDVLVALVDLVLCEIRHQNQYSI